MMDVYEQVAKDRIDAALREAEQRRAIRSGRVRGSRLVRLRSILARLGQWVSDHLSSVPSRPSTRSE